VVLTAAESGAHHASEALEQLCQAYWYPLYAYLRRRGFPQHDAEDLTQGFFASLLSRDSLRHVAAEKGRFRSFLLASLNHYVSDQRDRAQSIKRGGGRELLSLDAAAAETQYRLEPVDHWSPDRIFEYRWALALLEQVLRRLQDEFDQLGKEKLFEHLRPYLVAGGEANPIVEAARHAGLSQEAMKKAVTRMRRRYYQLFREEIAKTVSSQEEVESELRDLCAVLGGPA
jgi:RNA polymerase sigma-70 factor (ECF subfamily)